MNDVSIPTYNIVHDGNDDLYIADSMNFVILKRDMAKDTTSVFAGSVGVCDYSGDGSVVSSGSARFNNPLGLAFNKHTNALIIADNGNSRIRSIDLATGLVSTIAGTGAVGYSGDGSLATLASFSNPVSVTVDVQANVYISDRNNSVIRVIDSVSGIITTFAGTGVAGYNGDDLRSTTAQLNHPYGIATGKTIQSFYVADTGNNKIRFTIAVICLHNFPQVQHQLHTQLEKSQLLLQLNNILYTILSHIPHNYQLLM
jgi:sugar lactone lactonase YvrE